MTTQNLIQVLLGISSLLLVGLGLSLIYLNNLYISLGIFAVILINLYGIRKLILKNN